MAKLTKKLQQIIEELKARGVDFERLPLSLGSAKAVLKDLGPQQVGGRYLCGYWRKAYTVKAIYVNDWRWSITVEWEDGRVTTHSTPWDTRDEVLTGGDAQERC